MLGQRHPAFPLLWMFCVAFSAPGAASVSIEGAPADTGFNVGSVATIFATVKGTTGEASPYVAFADIQYVGSTTVTSVEMERASSSAAGELRFEAGWPIPADAPTGLYSVVVRVEDRQTRKTGASQRLRSFAVYKKVARIARVALDKTFYAVGEPIQCEVVLENLTGQDLKDLRVEFSNANYPWISLFSGAPGLPAKPADNPELALHVLGDRVNLAAHTRATLAMRRAGTATFLQGTQVAVLGTGGPARHEKVPPPEVDRYTIALWNADRSELYDMQFSPMAIVRVADRDLPKPYSHNFTHAYNSDIDFTKYRRFYSPEQVSPVITVTPARTLFRPGERAKLSVRLKNPGPAAWNGAELRARIMDRHDTELHAGTALSGIRLAPGQESDFEAEVWTVPESATAGVYTLTLSLTAGGSPAGILSSEVAVNALPSSLLVFGPHEDDERAYAGLIRAAVEGGIPVRVVIFTGGDVGACERYYSKPCGPNEAREFGMVRMEETAEALEHIGLARDRLVFLGLPDGGLGAIWSKHLKASDPFMSIYLATDHAPYENLLRPNLPYARDAVMDLVKQIIRDVRPAMIATPHPDERHVDHRTANWFVLKACQELLREKQIDPQTAILADQVYGSGGFRPAPYQYEKMTIFLSGEAAALKQEMGWLYQSQDGNLAEGRRQPYAELPREEVHYRVVDWTKHAGWNE